MRLFPTICAAVICLPVICLPVSVTSADEPKTSTPAKESVTFDGQTLWLASTSKKSFLVLREYIPKGEKLNSWTKLAGIHEYPQLNDPKAIAENVVRALKKQNPRAPHQLMKHADKDAYMVDFITWPKNGAFVEFNIFRYEKKKGGGLVAHQYALRAYKGQREFLKKLKTERLRILKLMGKDGLVVRKPKTASP